MAIAQILLESERLLMLSINAFVSAESIGFFHFRYRVIASKKDKTVTPPEAIVEYSAKLEIVKLFGYEAPKRTPTNNNIMKIKNSVMIFP